MRRMMARTIQGECQRHRLRYGEPPTTKQAARMTAELHHQLTRIGGYRPFGCTAILIGVSDEDGGTAGARIFVADPGGGVEECRQFCAAGNPRAKLGKELMAMVGEAYDNEKDTTANKKRSSIANIAVKMARKFLREISSGGNKRPSIDVWTIQPNASHRGGMLATCYSDVRKDNVEDIIRHGTATR